MNKKIDITGKLYEVVFRLKEVRLMKQFERLIRLITYQFLIKA